ncbi:MAG: hypothetical protein J2P33_21445, partial [Actinobacteria bacterium]|nr:hypothetical protein [Actinomycetota bacterium]
MPWHAMTWASVALAAFVAETEAGTVIQEATPTGQYSLGAVYGVGQVFSRTIPATLAAWTQASHQSGGLWLWLTVQGGFGVLLIAGYLGLGLALRRPGEGGDRPGGAALPRLADRWRLRQWLPLYLLALVNLVQDGIAITIALTWIRRHDYVPAGLSGALEGAVIAKWVMAVVVAGWLGYRVLVSTQSAPRARQIGSALKKQRFSVVIVVLLGVMAAARGTDVLEQLPDVQRAWLTWPPSLGWAQLVFAVLAQALLAVVLVLLSAMRVQRARAARLPEDRRDVHSYLPWLLTSLVVPALAVVLWLSGGAAVAWRRVIAIPLVLCAVALISVVIQFAGRSRGAAGPGPAGAAAGAGPGSADDAGRADQSGA